VKGCTCAQVPDGYWCPTCLPYARLAGLVLGVQERQEGPRVPRQGQGMGPQATALLEAPRSLPDALPRYRSKTEARFVQEIAEPRKRAGEIAMYAYEAITLKLAPAVRFTADFLCMVRDEPLPVLAEIKGAYTREDAWQKLKIAAAMYPMFRFELWTYKDKQWTCKQIPNY